MPKLGALTKARRDEAILKGLGRLFGDRQYVEIAEVRYTKAALAAKFERHLRALARVRELTIERRAAIQEERQIEADLQTILWGVKTFAKTKVGKHSSRMRQLGFEPDNVWHMSAQTKAIANEKRQKTRRKRGIVSKKRR